MSRTTVEGRREYEKMRNIRDGEKRRAARKAYYKKHKKAHRNTRLKNCYGLKPGQYEAMLEAQKHYCASCGDHETLSRFGLVVDHNHKTKTVRALICDACNRTIGHSKEDIERLLWCASYLRRFSNA